MIVRILGEGQYDVSDEAMDRLNELDAAVESAVEAGDAETFSKALAVLLDGVRTAGVARDAESLDESDLIRRCEHRRRPRAAGRRRPDPARTPSYIFACLEVDSSRDAGPTPLSCSC